jgi:hypothetical protein
LNCLTLQKYIFFPKWNFFLKKNDIIFENVWQFPCLAML